MCSSDLEKKIKEYGGIELFLGGIGEDGHIAFNVPSFRNLLHDRVLINH